MFDLIRQYMLNVINIFWSNTIKIFHCLGRPIYVKFCFFYSKVNLLKMLTGGNTYLLKHKVGSGASVDRTVCGMIAQLKYGQEFHPVSLILSE